MERETPLPIVSFLGPASSYTHQVHTFAHFQRPAWSIGLTDYDLAQAALGAFGTERYDFKPAATITDVFDAVQAEEAALGVVPIENSTNGAVIFTLELLADRHDQHRDVLICREAYLNVSHCLLGRTDPNTSGTSITSGACTPTLSTPSPIKPRASPLVDLRHIKKLYSHPQAWGQCEAFLSAYLKGIERIDVSSTSKAAEMASEDESGTSAAIASKLAATIHHLDILAQGIEDREDNTTRFFVLRKGVDEKEAQSDSTKTMISFMIDHSKPGALASVLNCFQMFSLNLTSINSRPTKVVPFQYVFFVEFEGSIHNDPTGNVHAAMEELNKYVQSWRWMGSWDQDPAIRIKGKKLLK